MSNQDHRDATATIRGYIYQFDATILKILNADRNASVVIEGVEDFDVLNFDSSEYCQCKYYSSKKFTPKAIRDALLPMLKNHKQKKQTNQSQIKYQLYGYFKEAQPEKRSLTLQELKESLLKRVQTEDSSGNKEYNQHNLQTELGLTDEDLNSFLEVLSIHISEEYSLHKANVIHALKQHFSCSQDEAEHFIYPTALSKISQYAICRNVDERTVSRATFLSSLDKRQPLFTAWLLRERGEEEYCKLIRRKFFSERNIESYPRFFIIELPENIENHEITHILSEIRNKWSSHKIKHKPTKERYAPYIFLRDINPETLVSIKQNLQFDGIAFVDGYPFKGASFNTKDIQKEQTNENPISLRFINSKQDFDTLFQEIRQTKIVYEFFLSKPLSQETQVRHIRIPITSLNQIANIV